MEITAKIKRIEDLKTVGQNNFKTRNLIVVTEDQYPQTLAIQFVQDKTAELDNFKPGDVVKISLSLRGNEITDKEGKLVVFNTIQGWKIIKM